TDGHGRGTVITERIHSGAAIEARETRTSYLPTGEVETVTRHRINGADPDIVRWMQYDSLGRRVLNAEPNVTKNFHSDPRAPIGTMRAWRYAYNDAGDLVGTSDARGCGANYGYDTAGRILFEDYSPCTPEQEDYSPPALAARTGIEVLYHYDDIDPADAPASTDFPVVSSLYLGRLAWVADRAAHTLSRYDGRGRATGVARRVAKPGAPALALAERYAPRWYLRKANFDAADRPIRESTGASVPELLGTAVLTLHEGHDANRLAAANTSVVTTAYTARGTVKRVGGSYGDLVGSVVHDADGLVTETRYGDVATTTTSFSYDNRRRLSSVQTYRGPPGIWTQPPPAYQPAPSFGASAPTTFQLLLQDEDFVYDSVDNPTEIRDWRLIDEWPAGAKPVTKKIQYDDLYRVAQVDQQYAGGDDAWTSPFAAENAGDIDPRRAAPSPHVSFDKRVLRQTFQYDWLGNTSKTTDDANGFYDRSLGAITNDVTSGKPYQLKAASNEATAASSPRRGHLTAVYDDAGNLVRLAVVRKGACLPTGANCSQLFAYDWDEVGRLVDARRWDVDAATAATLTASSPLPAPAPVAHLRHRYDSSDMRVIKSASDDATLFERSTLYIFGSLELRGAIPTIDGDYERASLTEVPYLMAHSVRLGRVVFEPAQVPVLDVGKTHVFLELGDHLGSTSVVLDKSTSELVERSTYQAYGAGESDYRPERWATFREDYRFTGKEEDVEVGLQYFGARFFSPALGRWASADPLAVQGPKGDLNLYAYVSGQSLRAIDPVGLEKVVERFEATNATVTYTVQDGGFLYDKSVGEEGTMYNVEFQTDKLTSAGIRPAAPSPAPMGKAAAPTPVATAEEQWQAAKAG
ncbi:MAG TPA: RHS repeat-associated core domain-containing protein, partial [Polyangiaceae bacterium]